MLADRLEWLARISIRQVELAALPVARKILRAALDAAIFSDEPGAANADDRRELQVALAVQP